MENKRIFWQALLSTLLIFGIGLILGLFLENYRSDNAEVMLINSEVRILDEQLRISSLGVINVSCDTVRSNTFDFANEIYLEALKLEDYDSSHKFKDTFLVLHKRYDLLRFLLWTEVLGLEQRCGQTFHTIVYLYDYSSDDLQQKARQNYFGRYLGELKEKYPEDMLLLPIAADMDLSSVNYVLDKYEIANMPAVIFDGQVVITENDDLVNLDKLVNTSLELPIVSSGNSSSNATFSSQ
ncbi:MAG: hypothetical protein AABX11_04660 [Nanoarchaeota archaeon]